MLVGRGSVKGEMVAKMQTQWSRGLNGKGWEEANTGAVESGDK